MIRILLTVFLGITILYYAFVVPRSSTSSTTYAVENTDDTIYQESSKSESWINVGDTSLFRDSMKGIVQTENMKNMSMYPQGELQTGDVEAYGIGMNNNEDDMRNDENDDEVPDRTSWKGKKGKKEMKRFFSKKGGKKGSHSWKGKKNDHNGKKGKKRDKFQEGKKESKSFKGKRR